VHNNYFKKLQDRYNVIDYFFEDSREVFDSILDELKETYSPKITGIIHGDFWFSNIIMEYNDTFKLIDMKGQVDNILTLNGDMYYDYGKFFQSILGFDLIINKCDIDKEYLNNMKVYFLQKCQQKGLNVEYLLAVTKSLILGTFHSIENNDIKIKLWKFIKEI
jgi:tRNA A-37 threonylcarbamoyl transferase component Bud32